MKKAMRAFTALYICLVLTFTAAVFNDTGFAKGSRAVSSKKKKSVQNSKRKSRSRSARIGKKSRFKKYRSTIDYANARSPKSRRGRLSRAERSAFNSYRSRSRKRARQAYLARLRAVRARDQALVNITAGNILLDNPKGEDSEVRRIAIEALEGRSGTVVVMDPNSGRVYAIVNQRMAVTSPVKPCSTVKLLVGLAALHEGVFDPTQEIQRGWTLTTALARSDNHSFDALGRLLGYDRVLKYAQNFGFGQATGINFAGESAGFLPDDPTYRYCSFGDGFGFTAIQLAAFTSAIANGGDLYVPQVPRTQDAADNFEPILKRKIEMTSADRARLMEGMIGAVTFGSGKRAYNPDTQIAGKTGTCTGSRDRLGLFTSFSSADNPKLVVTVITSGSSEAGGRAAAIAGKIYSRLTPRFFRERSITSKTATVDLTTGDIQ